jgi:8-hydroxy-5-deazaflavin:NADPH oxidoreductase
MSIDGVRTIGFIGAGNIGTNVARAAIGAGYDVVLGNSRGPETLTDVVTQLGPQARAATAEEAAAEGDLVVVAVPTRAVGDVPVVPLAGKTVVDANNYYPRRDGQIAELDAQTLTSSELLQRHLPEAHVVKAFNHIMAGQITADGSPTGSANRRALAIAGDDPVAKAQVALFLNEIGFDVVDVGPLAESWRIQPDTPGYGLRLNAEEMTAALAAAVRPTPR